MGVEKQAKSSRFEDVLHQAESFLSYWERVLKAVEAIRPDTERYLREILRREL